MQPRYSARSKIIFLFSVGSFLAQVPICQRSENGISQLLRIGYIGQQAIFTGFDPFAD